MFQVTTKNMKNILFLLFIPLFSFGQKVELDSMIVRNDSIFYVSTAKIYEHVADTTGLHERYMQLNEIITGLEAERGAIKERIAFFESNKPLGFIEIPAKVTLPVQPVPTKKQPARKPKKKKQ